MRAESEPGRPRRVLGLDPGGMFGWAVLQADAQGRVVHCASGTWRLTPGAGARGQRLAELAVLLERTVALHVPMSDAPLVLAIEDVRRHRGTHAAHTYGAYRGCVERLAHELGLVLLPQPVGLVKQRVTGRGNADKALMVACATDLFALDLEGDNHADALGVALCGLDEAARWRPA